MGRIIYGWADEPRTAAPETTLTTTVAAATVETSEDLRNPADGAAATPGDVNHDLKVGAGDARAILRHAAKIELLTGRTALLTADVDGDGLIRAADARLALRIAARLDVGA